MNRPRYLTHTIICIAILSGAVSGFIGLKNLRPKPEKREPQETLYNVQVFDAEPVNLREIVTGFGTVRADREVIVPAQVSGEIKKLRKDLHVGSRVTAEKTDVLAQIDSRPYKERRDRAKNQLRELDTELSRLAKERDNSKKMLDKSQRDLKTIQEQYERVKRNRARGAASPTEVTRALLEVRQYEQAVLELENAASLIPDRIEAAKRKQTSGQADLELAILDFENSTVVAPFAGSVSEVMVEEGQYVRVGDPLLRLTNTKLVEIPLPLPLTDFLKIERQLQAGEQPDVELAVNATDPAQWQGKVVRAAPEADASTRTVMVFVEVENVESTTPPGEGTQLVPLRPGTFVHARIAGPKHTNSIAIPRDAIADNAVFVAREGKAVRVPLDLGTRLQSLIVVEQGLEPGEKVVLTNLDVLRDGVKVGISDHVTLAEELARQRTIAARILPAE